MSYMFDIRARSVHRGIGLLCVAGVLLFLAIIQNSLVKAPVMPIIDDVVVDNTDFFAGAKTNVTSTMNDYMVVRDVGGTVKFQSTSSSTSAPVVPENPYLQK